MKVSLSWLKDYISISLPVSDIADGLTMAGLEVDSITDRYAWMASVKVGCVESVAPHPQADRLKLCTVNCGGGNRARVVCGAPNVHEGMLSPLALPGTVLPSGLQLEKTAIRGQTSEGMLCSAVELGLGPDDSGIMSLSSDLQPGMPLAEALGLSDSMLEIDLTPNRPDCLSILGIAREIGVLTGEKVRYPEIHLPEGAFDIRDKAGVTILAPEHCPRYAARLIEGIQVKESPAWLKERLISVGLRPINNIVDVTNFVMMEMGQPLHAFDFDRLAEGRIVVRTAENGEIFTTLDGKSRLMTDEMLMICDGQGSIAVAGVMGGLNSEIEAGTSRVLIESACFNPVSVRRTAKKLGLGTDASHRFERGVDPENTVRAADRAAQLMLAVGGGILARGVIDERPVIIRNSPITLNIAQANRLLGTDLSETAICDILNSIEFQVEGKQPGVLSVLAPSFRVDVQRPEDIMEEIVRIHGYNQVPVTFPRIPAGGARISRPMQVRQAVKTHMVSLGFSETINYSFIAEDACDRMRLTPEDERRNRVRIRNPISEDLSVMRTSLIPGLLMTAARNIFRQNRDLRLFEVGMRFMGNGPDALPREEEMAAGVWTGRRIGDVWHTRDAEVDFYDMKGVVESLIVSGLDIRSCRFTALPDPWCRTTRAGYTAQILMGEQLVGIVGEVHPEAASAFEIRQKAYVFELSLTALQDAALPEKTAKGLPRFPSVARDLTLIVNASVEASDILQDIVNSSDTLVEDVFLFDCYAGEQIPDDRKSLSFRIIFRSAHETLSDEAVSERHQAIAQVLLQKYNASFPT